MKKRGINFGVIGGIILGIFAVLCIVLGIIGCAS